MQLRISHSTFTGNHANEGGGAIFYVSNDSSGRLHLRWSTLEDNVSAKFENLPGIYFLGRGSVDRRHTILR
jgi:predicted outer membrane repeat protein